MHGKEFIYKEKPSSHISDLVDRITGQLKQHFKEERIEIVASPNTAEFESDKIDPTKVYFQVVSVMPYFESSEKRQTLFDQNFNISNE